MERNPDGSKYDFDCPQIVDFTDLGDDDNADEWFEYHDEEEEDQSNISIESNPDTGASPNGIEERKSVEEEVNPASSNDSDVTTPVKQEERDSAEEEVNSTPSNDSDLTTPVKQEERDSAEEEVNPTPSNDSDLTTPVKQEERNSAEEEVIPAPSNNSEATSLADQDEVDVNKNSKIKVKLENTAELSLQPDMGEAINQNQSIKTESETSDESTSENKSLLKRPPTPARALRRSMMKQKPSNIVTSWDHIKLPITVAYPDGTSNKASGRHAATPSTLNLKTTEQIELERMDEAKKAMVKSRQVSQQSLQMVRASRSYTPTKSLQPPTKPHGFSFETDNRLKFTKEKEKEKEREELEKQRIERKRSKAARRPIIKAPLLTSIRKRGTGPHAQAPPVKTVKTVALQIREFHQKTPDRFHSKPVHEQNKGPCGPKRQILGLTIPRSPALTTVGRKRAVTIMSMAEKEELEVEEMKKYKFRANPIDNRIYSMTSSNATMHTSSSSDSKEKEEEEKFEFHARPIPAKMLEGVTGVGKVKQIPVTCPKSPAFSLKYRFRPKEPEPSKEEEIVIKARPVPHMGVPFKPNLNRKTTTPEPFSFADRDVVIQAKKEAKVQEIYKQEQEARIFHAQPLPDQKEQIGIPVKKTKPITKQEPFNLDGETNGAKRAEKWAEEVEKELVEQKRRCSSFRARPANVLYQEPFKPEKPNKPLTDISDFQLNTDKRAVEREHYEKKKYEMEMKKIAEIDQQRLLEEEEEQRAITRLRSEIVHKAQPVHHFKRVNIQPSDKPLTSAESPKFTDRRRSKMNL